jgi:Uma2 family endonuclease
VWIQKGDVEVVMEDLYRRRITIDEWYRIVDAGVFPENERLELIRGEILRVPPFGDRDAPVVVPRHAGCLRRLYRQFSFRLTSALVDVQSPISWSERHSAPQPDLALLRFREDLYSVSLPIPTDIFLVIEASNSDLTYERDTKIPFYSEASIPEAWFVDLNAERILVYRRPSPEEYQEVHAYRRGETIYPEAFPETGFAVDEILG